MISKRILIALGAMVLVPAIARAQTVPQFTQASTDPVAFCCEQEDNQQNGTGCTAVPASPAGLASCSQVYLDCGDSQFTCSPAPAAAAKAGGTAPAGNLHNCQCFNVP